MKLILKPNEMILRAGSSVLIAEGHKISGKLIVTNQRIYFKTLEACNKKNDKEILPADISELHFFNTLRLFPNGMNIITKNGKENYFKVSNRNEWAKLITKMY